MPKGIKEGQRIRLSGQGGSANSDLYLEIRFKRRPLFRAEGRDIYLDLPVTPWEAALGGRVTVPTLGGNVEVKIPANAQSGQKLRLRGRGLPGNPPGEQYAVLHIVTPAADNEEARELYQKMSQVMPMNPRTDMGVQS
ncbi:MAG: DnaJ C-terminal domain-containing protein [Pseudomonadota bacterium]